MVTELIRKRTLFSLLIAVVFIAGCKQEPKQNQVAEPVTKLKTPRFIADNAYANIEKQLSFGYRVPHSSP